MELEVFRRVYVPLSGSLYRIAYSYLRSEADAKDAVQDTFVRLWNSRSRLDGIDSPEAYAMTLVRNICIDRLRAAARHPSEEIGEMTGDDPPPESRYIDKERLRRVMKAMDELPDGERKAVRMRALEGKEYSQIALETGLSLQSLRVLLSRARKKLKEIR